MAFNLTHSFANTDVTNATYVNENDQGVAAALAGQYREIFRAGGKLAADAAAGTYLLGSADTGELQVSGATLAPTATPLYFYFDDADYTLSGLTLKFRLRFQVAANATQPTITFTVGLYPIAAAGSSDILTLTAGTVVSGSTVAHASPAASTITQGNSGDFTVPADGAYGLAVVTSNTLTNNAAVSLHAQLQVRAVV